jgi:predicted ATPase
MRKPQRSSLSRKGLNVYNRIPIPAMMALYVRKLTIKKSIRSLPVGMAIEFSPITLLVGENGCGKSTILDMLREHYGVKDTSYFKKTGLADHADVDGDDLPESQVNYFDFHGGDKKFAMSFGTDVVSQLQAMHGSSGQGLLAQLAGSGLLDAYDSLVLLDEPDRGASLNMQYKYSNLIRNLANRGNQLVVSTHSLPIMRLAGDCSLYSVQHQKQVSLSEFLDLHLQ